MTRVRVEFDVPDPEDVSGVVAAIEDNLPDEATGFEWDEVDP
jgi:hypothetical protein